MLSSFETSSVTFSLFSLGAALFFLVPTTITLFSASSIVSKSISFFSSILFTKVILWIVVFLPNFPSASTLLSPSARVLSSLTVNLNGISSVVLTILTTFCVLVLGSSFLMIDAILFAGLLSSLFSLGLEVLFSTTVVFSFLSPLFNATFSVGKLVSFFSSFSSVTEVAFSVL